MNQYDRVYAKVDLDAIRANAEAFHRHLPNAMLCAVIKTDGYGLGAVPVAKKIDDLVWGYASATIEEAVNLRRHGITKPILVLGFVAKSRFEELIRKEIRYAAYQEDMLTALSEEAVRLKKKAIVHIKLDTGMGRIGLREEEAVSFIKKAAALPGIELEGLFSHLATADMRDRREARKQTGQFQRIMTCLEKEGIRIPVCHIGNSAACMEMTDAPGNMFRLGISLYGYEPSDEMQPYSVPLQPSMELLAMIAHVKRVPAGTPIGYGQTFVTERESTIATLTIGYGDGYPRSLSNKGYVLINGKRARIAGRVCMDQTMVDVTDIPDVVPGKMAVIIGKDGDERITIEETAALAGSFNYELLCDLGKRIPRIYLSGGKIVGSKDYYADDYPDWMS